MPTEDHTPRRTVRIPDELWQDVKRKAADQDRTVTEVVIDLLRRWVRDYP